MLKIKDKLLGVCHCEIEVDSHSAVDSYIICGYVPATGKDLTDLEIERFNEMYSAEVQQYAWESGLTRNHN